MVAVAEVALAGPLRVDLLGAPQFLWHGAEIEVDTRKATALLAMLVTALSEDAGPTARDQVAAMFWPDADDHRARAALRRTLSALLAATGDAVCTTRSTIVLRPDSVQSDIITLRRLSRSDDREDLARAVGLVRGEFMAGFRLRECEPFDTWSAATSVTLRHELSVLLERLVVARLRHGELHGALTVGMRWLELDPLHEPAHRSVMRLLSWTGRRQDALDQYRRCVRVLADELGVAPVRATTAIFEAIRSGTLAPPKRPRRVGPPPARGTELAMVGRDEPLATLVAAADGPSGRLIIVSGESGVGRSRLAAEFATAAAPVLFARAHEGEAALSLSPITDLLREALPFVDSLDEELAVEISRVVPECRPAGRPVPPPLDSLGGRDRFFEAVARTLVAADVRSIVVEDVHAAGPAGAEVLAYLLHRLDRLRCPLVLTWREPGLPARNPIRAALASGRLATQTTTIVLDRLQIEDVAELLTQSARSDLDAQTLFTQTAGLPMLLIDAIRTGDSDGLSLPVRDLLAARLSEVSEEAGQVLDALAVCGGVADPGDLRTISGRGELETVEAIEEALRAGLLIEEAGGVAFTHDALRLVAYAELSLARRRLLHARAAEAISGRHAAQVAHHWHAAGHDDLAVTAAWIAVRQATDLFAHSEALSLIEFVIGLGGDREEVAIAQGDALVALARYEPALVAFERAASLVAPEETTTRAQIERRCADIHARTGDWQLADDGLAAAIDLLKDMPEDRLRSQLLADRAVVAVRAGSNPMDHVAAALAVADGDIAYVHDAAGLVALAIGDLAGAQAAFRLALTVTTDTVLRAAVLNNLAHAQAKAGAQAEAVHTARQALELGTSHGDRHRLAALHANLADRLHEIAETDEAMRHLKAAAALFAEVGADPLSRPDVWTLTSW